MDQNANQHSLFFLLIFYTGDVCHKEEMKFQITDQLEENANQHFVLAFG